MNACFTISTPRILLAGLLLAPLALEAATITVTSSADSGSNTLREAITAANLDSASDIIQFDAAVTSIVLSTPLPAITEPLVIDGTVNAADVEIDGATNAVVGNGVVIDADGCVVAGLRIRGFSGDGIQINGSNNRIGNSGQENILEDNGGDHIAISNSATGNWILPNVLDADCNLPISFGDTLLTTNDILDADTGLANNGQNWLELGPIDSDDTSVQVTLKGEASTGYTAILYTSTVAHPSGYGPGTTFLQDHNFSTNPSGDYTAVVPFFTTFAPGTVVTATITNDSTLDSSHYSANVIITATVPVELDAFSVE